MKRNVRRILSLVMVLVLLCGMVPAAMAATSGSITWDESEVIEHQENWGNLYVCLTLGHSQLYQGTYNGTAYYVCSRCGATGTSAYGYGSGTGNISGHSHVYSPYDYTQHQLLCYTYGSSCLYNGTLASHTYSGTGYCSDCGYYYGTGTGTGNHTHQYTQLSGEYAPYYHYTTCTDPTCSYYTNPYEAHTGTPCYYCGYTGYGTGSGSWNLAWYSSSICYGTGNLYGSHSPYYSYTYGGYDYYSCSYCTDTGYTLSTGVNNGLSWSNNSAYCDSYFTPHNPVLTQTYGGYNYYTCGNSGCNATATSYSAGTGSSSGSATGLYGKLYVTGYDSMTNDTYTLNESVTLSVSPSMWENNIDTTGNYNYYYTWSGATAYDNSGTAYLDTSKSTSTAYCTVTAYNKTGDTLTPVDSATIYWYASAIATDSIIYSALKGENVVLDEDDFEAFWEEQYPNGTLSYVRFTGVSTGNLYDNYSGGTSLRTDVRSRGSSCYLSPSATQIGLDDLTYVPGTYTSTNTVTIQFTAYGTSNYGYGYNYSSSYGTTSLSGTITILYTAKEVTPIVYSTTTDSVNLDGDDFIAKYKEVMDVSYTGSLSIQFLEAPAFGTLYMNYGSNYWYQTTGTQLTDKNIGSYSFSTSTVGTYSIDDLTYVPATADDTIRFACYSGNNLKFVGTVTFGSSEKYTVEITTTVGNAVAFSNTDFTNADSSGLLTSGYLYLGTPSAGTLYKNYANGTGTRVTTSDYFTAGNLSSITYVPRAGFVGTAEIPYTAYTYLGEQMEGTIKVYVGRAFTDVTGSNAWAVPYVNKLSAQGIVNGTDSTMTKFSPTKKVTYGEALKLIMMAAGYPEQAKTSTHWASGYLTKAYYDGLVSSSAIDLNAEVSRETIATITAKALKLSSASKVDYGVTAPSDSTNGYVYALYNAGIIDGVNSGGKNYFYGTKSITRAEISKIICMVADYDK